MDIRETFAKNLRKYRKAAKLSQEKLAEIAGVHRTYIGGIEQCRVNVSLKNIGKIADAMDVDPMLLFDGGESIQGSDFNSHAAWSRILQDADEVKRLAGSMPKDGVAVVIWTKDGINFRPLETGFEDLTIQVLIGLVQKGYSGDELVEQYDIVSDQILRFLGIGSRDASFC